MRQSHTSSKPAQLQKNLHANARSTFRNRLGRTVALSCVVAFSACGHSQSGGESAAPETALSGQEVASIHENIMALLRQRQFASGWTGKPVSCSDFFTLGDLTITDTALTGDTGKVRISVPVTFSTNQPYQRSDACFGIPPGGWTTIGQTSGWQGEFNLEHWQSGWRLAANQGP